MFQWIQNIFDRQMFGAARSPKWSEVRSQFLKENPICAVCRTKGNILKPLEVHHVQPFHENPELELQNSNLIVLCRPHHLLIGHLMSWKSWNIDVRQDAETLLNKIASRPQ
jgi:hypothetical protein